MLGVRPKLRGATGKKPMASVRMIETEGVQFPGDRAGEKHFSQQLPKGVC